jgi:hypothetical protein
MDFDKLLLSPHTSIVLDIGAIANYLGVNEE